MGGGVISGWDPVARGRFGSAPVDDGFVTAGSRGPQECEPASHPEELQRLIDEQQRDAGSYRVFGLSVDAFPSGADVPSRRLTAHDDRHGTLACYVRLECRCVKCRAASAEYARDRRRRTRLIACGCGTPTRRGRCLSCAMRDVWAARAA